MDIYCMIQIHLIPISSLCPGRLHAGWVAVQQVWHEGDVPCCWGWTHCHRRLLPVPLPCRSEKVTCACYVFWITYFSGEKRWMRQLGKRRRKMKRNNFQNGIGRPDCESKRIFCQYFEKGHRRRNFENLLRYHSSGKICRLRLPHIWNYSNCVKMEMK